MEHCKKKLGDLNVAQLDALWVDDASYDKECESKRINLIFLHTAQRFAKKTNLSQNKEQNQVFIRHWNTNLCSTH